MKNTEIKTKVITNSIVREIRETVHKNIDIGVVADAVHEILSDDDTLDAIKHVAWDQDHKKGVCAFTPEQLLELAPNGFNPCPIDLFVKGECDLKHAIEECFSLTFSSAWDDDCWMENSGDDLEDLDFDLFQVTYGDRTEDQWLATDKEGNALRDICPECREKRKETEEKAEPSKLKVISAKQVRN